MKEKIFLLVVAQLLVFNISAQNLGNSFGGVETNFQFFSDTTNLNPIDQMIIQRAERKSYGDPSFGTGWGYGYRSFHLEFITNQNITEKKFKHKAGRDNDSKLELTFYDLDNVVLATYPLNYSVVDLLYNSSSDRSQYFYSIDLIDIPIVLLNKTVKINFIKTVSDKK